MAGARALSPFLGDRMIAKRMLANDRHGAIDAPSWLRKGLVSLAGTRETGWLAHCCG